MHTKAMGASRRLVCSKCATNSKGELTCCAPGGAWYGTCTEDPNDEHTWTEGWQTCNRKMPLGTIPLSSGSLADFGMVLKADDPVCSQCARIKDTSRYSCCARGGAWFNNCGGSDSSFDHTWSEGLQACRRSTGLLSAQGQLNKTYVIPQYSREASKSEVDTTSRNEHSEIPLIMLLIHLYTHI